MQENSKTNNKINSQSYKKNKDYLEEPEIDISDIDSEEKDDDDLSRKETIEYLEELSMTNGGFLTYKDVIKYMPPGKDHTDLEFLIKDLEEKGIEIKKEESSDIESHHTSINTDDNNN